MVLSRFYSKKGKRINTPVISVLWDYGARITIMIIVLICWNMQKSNDVFTNINKHNYSFEIAMFECQKYRFHPLF